MKRQLLVTGMLGIVMAVVLMPCELHATPLTQPSELVQRALRHEQSLTTPDNCPASQRTLLAASIAAAEMRITDPRDILELYLIAGQQKGDLLTRETQYFWDESEGAWKETYRSTNTYDGANNLTQTLWEDMIESAWVNSALETNTYDGNGRLLTTTSQNWVEGAWENETFTTFEYDGSGNITRLTYEDWDADLGDWSNYMRITFTYTGGRLTSSTTEMWNAAWINFARSTYTYDGSNRISEILTELWAGDHWENSGKVINTYDGSGHLTVSLSQYWFGGAWVDSSKNEYTYDGSGNEIIDVHSVWFGTEWMVFDVDSSKYSGGKLVEVVHNHVFPVPVLSHTLYMYDGENLVEVINQDWMTKLSASSWLNTSRSTYEYEGGGSAVQLSDQPVPAGYELNQNYPNPFNPSTSIRYSLQHTSEVEVTVYNMLGQVVKTLESGVQAPGVYETTWDGTDANGHAVSSGLYLYRIATDRFTETRKMMLLK